MNAFTKSLPIVCAALVASSAFAAKPDTDTAAAALDSAPLARPGRKQAPRLRNRDSLGRELRRNSLVERARARAAAATQPR